MDNTIYRQAAIDALIEWYGCEPNGMDYFKEILAKKSSAQPVDKDINVPTNDTISRQAAVDDIKAMYEWHDVVTEDRLIEHMKRLPSAQPEPEEFEWCRDCKEYDQKQHCCHRWTKVIRKTVEELKADNPEIIFCKNCKHWYPDADTGMACEYTNMSQPEDGFCNWAERKEE